MKPLERHFWFGILLMLALLACTLTISWGIRAIHAPIGQTLQQAQEAVLTQDWTSARQAAQQAEDRWAQFRPISAAVADHDPIEAGDSLFAELALYAHTQSATEFAACCARLQQTVQGLIQAHTPKWWNLF